MDLQEFAARVKTSRSIVFFTGAGISTESGVPDFRSSGWRLDQVSAGALSGFPSERIGARATLAVEKGHLRAFQNSEPNVAHHSICAYEKRGQMLGLITQNIDGLHKLAGTSDEKLIELHGTDRLVTCLTCGKRYQPADVYENLGETFTAPTCDACGGFLKSANVSFGQPMPVEAMRRALAWSERADIFVVLGSSLQVQPAASFPVVAERAGALLGIVNRDPTPLDEIADFVHNGAIGDFFRGLQAWPVTVGLRFPPRAKNFQRTLFYPRPLCGRGKGEG